MVIADIKDIQNVEDIDTGLLKKYLGQLLDWAADKAFSLLIALVVLFIGMRLSRWLAKHFKKSFDRTGMEQSVSGFLYSLIKGIGYIIVVIAAVGIMGIQVSSLVALLGTAGLAVGLALQGSLANFAGGVLILIMKPFKVGDYIIENDKKCEGTVEAIDIFYTKLRTYDNKRIVIPNGNITSNSIINLTAEKVRRLEINVGVAYDSDIKKVKRILEDIILKSHYYAKEYERNVYVADLDDSSIKMGIRFYVDTDVYWFAKWSINEEILKRFAEEGIEIAFNQIDVNIKS